MPIEYPQSHVRVYDTSAEAFEAARKLMNEKILGTVKSLGMKFEVTVDVRNLAYAMSILG